MRQIPVSKKDVKAGLNDDIVKNAQIEPFTCPLSDGSIFKMPTPTWDRAYQMKYGSQDQEGIKRAFRAAVAQHWKERTVPTKFDFDEPWPEEFKTQAELAEKVMYPSIRAPLMGLVMAEMSGGKSKVIAIGEGGKITEYGKEAKTLQGINQALPKQPSKKRRRRK